MLVALTRRRMLHHIGLAAGAALLRPATRRLAFAPPQSPASQPRAADAPVIRTVLKDVAPDDIGPGALLFHEHLSMRYPIGAATHFTDDVTLMIEEVKAAAREGVSGIVDGGHADMQRSLDALRRIAAESGLHIVASGGYYLQRTYPAEIGALSTDQIADALVRAAATERWGALGEIGQSNEMTPDERKVFAAVANAHVRTGLPIFTHNPYNGTRPATPPVPRDAALRQLDVLVANGASPAHVAIGHICCLDDPKAEIARAIAARGAFVGFDRVTIPILPDAQKVTAVLALLDAGYADRLLLSSDFAVARSLKRNGGPGLAQTVTVFGEMLKKAGVDEKTLRGILTGNPRRFLAFVPRA
jgi:phosphotriesterase-related protein